MGAVVEDLPIKEVGAAVVEGHQILLVEGEVVVAQLQMLNYS